METLSEKRIRAGKLRWKGKSKKQIQEHIAMLNKKREEKRYKKEELLVENIKLKEELARIKGK